MCSVTWPFALFDASASGAVPTAAIAAVGEAPRAERPADPKPPTIEATNLFKAGWRPPRCAIPDDAIAVDLLIDGGRPRTWWEVRSGRACL